MQTENKYPLELIDKVLNKTATVAEQQQLQSWIGEDKSNGVYFIEMQKLYEWTSKDNEDFAPNVDEAWYKLQARIEQKEVIHVTGKPLQWKSWTRIAATIAVAVGVALLVLKIYKNDARYIQAVATSSPQIIYLPDSSMIRLGAHSHISYSSDFNEDNRIVTLDGEGYFEVRKKNGMAFKVIGKNTTTEVLGTSFLITTANHNAMESIVVYTGKVKYSENANKENAVILLPGDKAQLQQGKAIAQSIAASKNELYWKTKQLRFEDENMKTIVAILENNFAAKINLQNVNLESCHFTGAFENATLEEIVQVVAASINAKVQKEQDAYILSGAGCNVKSD